MDMRYEMNIFGESLLVKSDLTVVFLFSFPNKSGKNGPDDDARRFIRC